MDKSKVSIVKLDNYQAQNVAVAVEKGLGLLGGLEQILKPRSRVFVKINLLSPASPPDKGIITHPAFARGVLGLLKEFGAEITVGDDISSENGDSFLPSGYREVCRELDIRLVNLKETGFREVRCNGKVLEKVYISPLVLEADFILNLPKLKTHSYTIYTGAIKNLFGVIPHGLRIKYHRLFQNNEIFSEMLVDILSCAPPHLTIMDAVMAMEGEGPSAGNVKKVGLILASRDAVALDAMATYLIGINPLEIPTTRLADERGLGQGKIGEIEVMGEDLEEVRVKKFKHSAIAVGLLQKKIPSFLYAYFQDQLTLIPKVLKHKCTACGECVRICPVNAAQRKERTAWIDEKKCIHCLCCHEVCPEAAIKLKQLPIGRAIRGLATISKRLRSVLD
jgi:uncharacterized protein (DUF362 family)/NAD-dependent dihydropyrimidine dehydrogenase PreA subunit